MTNHVIIGNGVAGIKAAETIRRNDSDCKITVIGDETCFWKNRGRASLGKKEWVLWKEQY